MSMGQFYTTYSIGQNIESKQMRDDQFHYEMRLALGNLYTGFSEIDEDFFRVYFSRNLTTEEAAMVSSVVSSHVPAENYGPIINSLVSSHKANSEYFDIDYKIEPRPNLHPQRQFVQGELQTVYWYNNEFHDLLVIRVDIEYTRDAYGFALERETVRTWFDFNGNEMPFKKVTKKEYSPIEMIKEGKKRRGNIVDGVQIPVLAFLQEAAMNPEASAEYSLNPSTVILTGRGFMDRFATSFKNFIENSSTIIDTNSPNFGKKTVVVEFESAAENTDLWLNYKPSALGGASILQYLVGEFSI